MGQDIDIDSLCGLCAIADTLESGPTVLYCQPAMFIPGIPLPSSMTIMICYESYYALECVKIFWSKRVAGFQLNYFHVPVAYHALSTRKVGVNRE